MRRPAINYVLGREIVVSFKEQQVTRVTVNEQAAGVYLEPVVADTARARPDTARARPAPTTPPARTTPAPVPSRPPR